MLTRLGLKFTKAPSNLLKNQFGLMNCQNYRAFGKFLRERQSIHRGEVSHFNENTLYTLQGERNILH